MRVYVAQIHVDLSSRFFEFLSIGIFPEEDAQVGAGHDVLETFLQFVLNFDEASDCVVAVRSKVDEEGLSALEDGLETASESLQTRQLGLLSRDEHCLGFSGVVIDVVLPL